MSRPGVVSGGTRAAVVVALVAVLGAVTLGAASSSARADLSSSAALGIAADGPVNAITQLGSTIYLGGSFSNVGLAASGSTLLDASTAAASTTFPVVSGGHIYPNGVYAAVPDGSGGFYIGGSFTSVGGAAHTGLAHIEANGTVDPTFEVSIDGGVVRALALSPDGHTLYVAGAFNTLGGVNAPNIGSVDLSLTPAQPNASFAPNSNGTVNALAISSDGTTLYAGGSFSFIGGAARSNLVALNATTGNATSTWNPAPDGAVRALVLSSDGSTLYTGGSFAHIGGATRGAIAQVSTGGPGLTDGAMGSGSSGATGGDGEVEALALSANGVTLFVGGSFTSIGGSPHANLGAILASGGAALGLDADTNLDVESLLVDPTNNLLYVGGGFTSLSGYDRNRLGVIDISNADPSEWSVTSWDPNMSNHVYALALNSNGSEVYAGGLFQLVNQSARNNLAAISATDGSLQSWDPDADGTVWAMASAGSTIYVGGQFQNVGGAAHAELAALDTSGNALAGWSADVTGGSVLTLALTGSDTAGRLYVGGSFTSIGGDTHNYIGAVAAVNGHVQSWDPGADNTVRALAYSSDFTTIYAGGDFDNIGGQARSKIAALHSSDGSAYAWNPDVTGDAANVEAIAVTPSTIYVGGSGPFNEIGANGASRGSLAALDPSTGNATSWNPAPDGVVDAIATDGSTVYIGGGFQNLNGEQHNSVAAVDATTGQQDSFDPEPDDYVNALLPSAGALYIGGDFGSLASGPGSHFAAFVVPVQNSAAPSISGTPNPGDTLTCDPGTWTGTSPSFSYAWSSDGSPIPGATDPTYDVQFSDVGHSITCIVTASNLGGSVSATTGAVTPDYYRAPRVFWANETGQISWATLDGSGTGADLDTSGATLVGPNGIGIDTSTGKIWGSDCGEPAGSGDGNVWSADVDGAGNGANLVTEVGCKSGATVYDGKLYWTNVLADTIEWETLDGSSSGTLPIASQYLEYPSGVAIDVLTGRIYWANYADNVHPIAYANLDGTDPGFLGVGSATGTDASGLALDTATGKVYWTYSGFGGPDSSGIGWANLDPANPAGGLLETGAATVASPWGIAIDVNGGKIYWANEVNAAGSISWADENDDGTGGDLDTGDATVSGPGYPALLEAPSLASGPGVIGTTRAGNQLTCAATWKPDQVGSNLYEAPQSTAFQWQRDGTPINGATAAHYTLQAADVGHIVKCQVSGKNLGGGFAAANAGTKIAPGNSALPALAGVAEAGHALTCTLGTWVGTGLGFARQWLRNGSPISAATAMNYTPAAADVGKQVSCRVTASKNGASAAATSTADTVYAADGAGAVATSPGTVSAGQTGRTVTVTYTVPTGGMAAGALALVVPAGWTAPQKTSSSSAGYVTTSAGTLSIGGSTITVSGLTKSAGQTVTITYKNAKATATTGAQTWQLKQKSIAAGTLTNCPSSSTITVYAKDGAGTMSPSTGSVAHHATGKTITFTFTVGNGAMNSGAITLAVPAGWSAPQKTSAGGVGYVTASAGTVSISSRTITVSGLTKTAGQTVTVTCKNASAPTTAVGSQTWTAQERSTLAGILTTLAGSPKISVT